VFDAGSLDPLTVRARFAGDVRASIPADAFHGPALEADRIFGVAPPRTDRETLACASGAFDRDRGGFPSSATPVLGATATRGEESFAVAVARARGGGYLIGSCRTRHPEWGTDGADTADGFVVPAPGGGPENLFAVVPVQPGQPAADLSAATATKLLAIAPAGATQVRFGDVTAPVEDRMAIVEWPDRTPIGEVDATALDASGRTLGTARVAPGAHEVEAAAFYDPVPVEPPRYVTPTN
jgi:hypothetical protein